MTTTATQCVSDGGLINPDAFPARAADLDPAAVTASATSVRGMGRAVDERTRAVDARWGGLTGCYEAPEQGQVYALMQPAVTSGDELRSAFTSVAAHLDTYAAALASLKPRLQSFEDRAAAFRASVINGVQVDASEAADAGVGDTLKGFVDWVPGVDERQVTVPWYEDSDTVARNQDLLEEYAGLLADVSAASADCANAINGLVTGMCPVPAEALPAEAFTNPAQPMPWGEARDEDRSCPESVGHGAARFGTGLWDGATMLVAGRDPESGEWFQGSAYGQAWGGLGDFVGSTLLLASPVGWVAAGMSATGNDNNGFSHFMEDRANTFLTAGGSLIGYDPNAEDPWHAWREDAVATGTASVLSVGTFFIPGAGQVGAGLKVGSAGAKVARIAAAGADVVVQGGSWAVRGGVRVAEGLGALLRFGDDVPLRPGQAASAGATGARLSPAGALEMLDDLDGAPTAHRPVSDDLFPGAREDGPSTGTAPVPGRLDVPPEYRDLRVVDADGGTKGGWNSDLHRPEPSTVYRIDDRHLFVTDAQGRVTHVESVLEYRDPAAAAEMRNGYQQKVAGREFRLEIDEGGHIVGVALGGPGEGVNLIPMDRLLNRGSGESWGAMERAWLQMVKQNPDAGLRMTVDLEYPGGSARPELLIAMLDENGHVIDQREFEQ